jgi:hypothetical protein
MIPGDPFGGSFCGCVFIELLRIARLAITEVTFPLCMVAPGLGGRSLYLGGSVNGGRENTANSSGAVFSPLKALRADSQPDSSTTAQKTKIIVCNLCILFTFFILV